MIRQPRILAILLTILVFWSALPFGSVTVTARFGLFLGVGLLLFLSAWTLEPRAVDPPRGAVIGLVVLALLGVVQSIPLPASLLGVISPARLALAEKVAELAETVGRDAPVSKVALSVAPWNTLQTSLFLAIMAAAVVISARACREREQRRILLTGVVAAGLFQVVYGGGRFAGGGGRIWGREVAEATGRLRGTFVNPNHFSFFVGLVLPLVFAWGWWALRRANREREPARYLALVGPPLLIWIMLFVGAALSGSRAGLLSALITILVQALLVALRKRSLRLAPLGLMLAAAGLAVTAAYYFGQASEGAIARDGVGRLTGTNAEGLLFSARFEVWRASFDLFRDYPWLGVGLGTFREIFPMVQPEGLGGTWWHAHSDLLEIQLTAGLVGVLVVFLGYLTLMLRLTRIWNHAERSEDRTAGLAGLGALLAATLHSCFDFGLTMPANALLLSSICGATAATSFTRRSARRRQASGVDQRPDRSRADADRGQANAGARA